MSGEVSEFGEFKIYASEVIPPKDVWMGPEVSPRLLSALLRGEVTLGGLAEAGWHCVGKLSEDGIQ